VLLRPSHLPFAMRFRFRSWCAAVRLHPRNGAAKRFDMIRIAHQPGRLCGDRRDSFQVAWASKRRGEALSISSSQFRSSRVRAQPSVGSRKGDDGVDSSSPRASLGAARGRGSASWREPRYRHKRCWRRDAARAQGKDGLAMAPNHKGPDRAEHITKARRSPSPRPPRLAGRGGGGLSARSRRALLAPKGGHRGSSRRPIARKTQAPEP
jgi:hypothetical protein